MSSSARFAQLINSAYINDDKNAALSYFNEFQQTQCLHPARVRIFDAHTQRYRYIMVNCGRCYHCRQTKINEWCTRMYAHCEDFKNVYFVTLTYRSFTSITNPVNVLMLNKLQDAVFHYDSFNSLKRPCYSPCLLVKSHYQNFIKRLRKYSGLNDITYVLSGEYGHDYGRPHFHMILFTNGELTEHDIVRAWSVALWRSDDGVYSYRRNQKYNGAAFDFPIGRVDIHNLVTNGSFNTASKIKVDGQFMNSARCFSYVCKYVCKAEKPNLKRVSLAYHSLYHKETFCNVYSNEMQFHLIKDYLLKVGYKTDIIESKLNEFKSYSYEKFVFQPDSSVYSHGLEKSKKTSLFGHSCVFEFYPSYYLDFCSAFKQFCEFSRSTPIGSVYATRNISQFAEGVFTRPILQDSGFVVPSYFRRKVQEYLYGVRKLRKSMFSVTYPLGGLVDFYRRVQDYLQNGILPVEHINSEKCSYDIGTLLQSSHYVFRDAYSGERILLIDDAAMYFKYNRSFRKYDYIRSVPIRAFFERLNSQLIEEFQRYACEVSRAKANAQAVDASLCKLTDMGVDIVQLKESFESNQKALYIEQQKMYHESKSSTL